MLAALIWLQFRQIARSVKGVVMLNTKLLSTNFLSRWKRRLIGGCWVRHTGENFHWCIKSYWGKDRKWSGGLTHWDGGLYNEYHKTLVSIEEFEDYGDVTKLGNILGYSCSSAKRLPMFFPWGDLLDVTLWVLIIGYFTASYLELYPFGNHC